jgi:hypothetical protein
VARRPARRSRPAFAAVDKAAAPLLRSPGAADHLHRHRLTHDAQHRRLDTEPALVGRELRRDVGVELCRVDPQLDAGGAEDDPIRDVDADDRAASFGGMLCTAVWCEGGR